VSISSLLKLQQIKLQPEIREKLSTLNQDEPNEVHFASIQEEKESSKQNSSEI